MQRFTELYFELDQTTKTSVKVAALRRYFQNVLPADGAWGLYFLTGRRFRRVVSSRRLRNIVAEMTGLPQWLVEESYQAVGDLAETIALLLEQRTEAGDVSLREVVDNSIAPLSTRDQAGQEKIIRDAWSSMSTSQRLVYNKLVMGSFRVGVAKRLVTRALAEAADLEPAVMAHRLMGRWSPSAQAYRQLLSHDAQPSDILQPYPFFFAHPVDDPAELGDPDDWLAEWKWDGTRAQLIHRNDQTALWSRGEELIGQQFPEIIAAGALLPEGTVFDGEIVAWENGRPLPFSTLQLRLGRRNVEPMLFADVPVVFLVFDLLEQAGDDLRSRSLQQRRDKLQQLIEQIDDEHIHLSRIISENSWDDYRKHYDRAREHAAEGLMLKRLSSAYSVGRTRGDWWKWKVQPLTLDAVLINAQLGSGKRASMFTDYTFGVWEDDELTPVAKAYSGLTDAEIRKVDRHIRRTTLQRAGPVRIVRPELVFELGFEGIQRSSRHKAGLALRFPRMLRWRHDKKPTDADTLDSLRQMLASLEKPPFD